MPSNTDKWAKLLNGPTSKPELTAREMLEIALAKHMKKIAKEKQIEQTQRGNRSESTTNTATT